MLNIFLCHHNYEMQKQLACNVSIIPPLPYSWWSWTARPKYKGVYFFGYTMNYTSCYGYVFLFYWWIWFKIIQIYTVKCCNIYKPSNKFSKVCQEWMFFQLWMDKSWKLGYSVLLFIPAISFHTVLRSFCPIIRFLGHEVFF